MLHIVCLASNCSKFSEKLHLPAFQCLSAFIRIYFRLVKNIKISKIHRILYILISLPNSSTGPIYGFQSIPVGTEESDNVIPINVNSVFPK